MTASDAASLRSSVSALKLIPSTATRLLRKLPPTASAIRSASLSLRAALASMTASTIRDRVPACLAIEVSARVSLGKQEPPNPGPGWR